MPRNNNFGFTPYDDEDEERRRREEQGGGGGGGQRPQQNFGFPEPEARPMQPEGYQPEAQAPTPQPADQPTQTTAPPPPPPPPPAAPPPGVPGPGVQPRQDFGFNADLGTREASERPGLIAAQEPGGQPEQAQPAWDYASQMEKMGGFQPGMSYADQARMLGLTDRLGGSFNLDQNKEYLDMMRAAAGYEAGGDYRGEGGISGEDYMARAMQMGGYDSPEAMWAALQGGGTMTEPREGFTRTGPGVQVTEGYEPGGTMRDPEVGQTIGPEGPEGMIREENWEDGGGGENGENGENGEDGGGGGGGGGGGAGGTEGDGLTTEEVMEGTEGTGTTQGGLRTYRPEGERASQMADYLGEYARSAMESPSRYDADVVQQGTKVIEDAINRVRGRGTRSLEDYYAGRGLTGSSLEAEGMSDFEMRLQEEAARRASDLQREQAMTYGADRASAFGFGMGAGGLASQVEQRTLDDIFRREYGGRELDIRGESAAQTANIAKMQLLGALANQYPNLLEEMQEGTAPQWIQDIFASTMGAGSGGYWSPWGEGVPTQRSGMEEEDRFGFGFRY